jgi:hypothetical protein
MPNDYKAIKGFGSAWGGLRVGLKSKLYQAPDHLLLVLNSGYTEEYKRVFYRDVRYVVARESNDQTIQAWVSAAGFLLFSLFFYFGHWGIGIVCTAPFALWFTVNVLRGSTCRTFINTDVQTLELPLPRRDAKVPALIAFLNSKLTADQPPAGPVT